MGPAVPALGEGGTLGEEVVEKEDAEGVESRGNHPEEDGEASPHVETQGGGVSVASRRPEIIAVGESERTETSSVETQERCLIHTTLAT